MLSSSFASEEHQEDEELKCPKCLSFFFSSTKPYILPCNHNICLNCIDKLISENNTKCPICNNIFNKKDRNSFEVNFGFLNLVIKILQTKIIFCTKCNKIFYWKDHYDSCEQKYFDNCNNIFEEIKINCEEGENIIKIINDEGDLLNKHKKEIGNLVKNIISEIHKKYIDNIELKINNDLFKTNININFNKSKLEIINFMKLCLSYPKYFNTKEIIRAIDYISNYESKLKNPNMYSKNRNNKYTFSPPCYKQPFLSRVAFYNKKNDNDKENLKYNPLIRKNNFYNFNTFNTNRHLSTIYYNEKNNKEIISEEDDDDSYIITNNTCDDDEGINESDRIKVKVYHDNNISKFKKVNGGQHINTIQSKSGSIKSKILFNNQKPIKTTKLKMGYRKKNNKFDINSLLDDDINIEEYNTKNKIIVGLKDVKVISLKQSINNNSLETKNKINSKLIKSNYLLSGKGIDLDNLNSINNKEKMNNSNNKNNTNNKKLSKTLQFDTPPSLDLLRSSAYSKREYRFNTNQNSNKFHKIKSKLNKSVGINNFSNTISVDQFIEENLTRKNLKSSFQNITINHPLNIIKEENNIFSMNKIIKNFNKIKDITNQLKNYTELITFLYNYINKDIENNIHILKDLIMNDYGTLLNEISYNSNRCQKNFFLTHLKNTYNILIYDPFNKKYKIKNYNQIFKKNRININPFNNSISIVFDDNDLIFISGGENNFDLFLIVTWSTGKIIHIESMQTKKAYHKTIYFNEKLYLIGGMSPDNNTSSECFFFCLKEKKWHIMPNLNIPRKNASLCFYNNSILYIFRGEDNNNVLDTIEYINIKDINKKWNIFKPIDNGYVWYPAKNSMVITIDKNKILICGGEDNDSNLYKDCFLFEPHTNSLYKGLDLVFPASFISEGCFYQDEIFAIDYKNKTQNRIIHLCNTKKNYWKFRHIK